MKDSPSVNIIKQDVKLVITTVTIVVSVLTTFFTLKNEVALINQKLDTAIANMITTGNTISTIIDTQAKEESRIAVLEAKEHTQSK